LALIGTANEHYCGITATITDPERTGLTSGKDKHRLLGSAYGNEQSFPDMDVLCGIGRVKVRKDQQGRFGNSSTDKDNGGNYNCYTETRKMEEHGTYCLCGGTGSNHNRYYHLPYQHT